MRDTLALVETTSCSLSNSAGQGLPPARKGLVVTGPLYCSACFVQDGLHACAHCWPSDAFARISRACRTSPAESQEYTNTEPTEPSPKLQLYTTRLFFSKPHMFAYIALETSTPLAVGPKSRRAHAKGRVATAAAGAAK